MSEEVPQAIDEERAVLCSLINRPDTLTAIRPALRHEYFLHPDNRAVYLTLCEMADEGVPVNSTTIIAHLRQSGLLGALGNEAAFVCELDMIWHTSRRSLAVDTPEFVGWYVERMRRAWQERTRKQAAAKYLEGELTFEEVKRVEAETELEERAEVGFRAAVLELAEDIEHRGEGQPMGLPSGFPELDQHTGGWIPPDLIVIGGPTSSGKTAFAVSSVLDMAVRRNVPVGIFSLEMSDKEIAMRLVSQLGRIPLLKLRHGRLTPEEQKRFSDASMAISRAPIYIHDPGDLTIEQMRAQARYWKAEFGIRLLVLDYIQLIQATGDTREQAVSGVSRACKAMAKELGVPVLALSQLNEEGKLRESRAIGHDADLILIIGDEEINIAKQRNGPRDVTIRLTFTGEFAQWASPVM